MQNLKKQSLSFPLITSNNSYFLKTLSYARKNRKNLTNGTDGHFFDAEYGYAVFFGKGKDSLL